MGSGSGLSRGDRNRNARLARLRELVPLRNAIMGSTWLMTRGPRVLRVCGKGTKIALVPLPPAVGRAIDRW